MKKVLVILMAAASVAVAAGQSVITAWDFETSINTPSAGAGSNELIGSFSNPASGSGSLSGCAQQSGTGAWQIGTAAPGVANETSGVQFLFSTFGYENIVFAYDHRTSNSGTRTARIQYTIDGSNWINLDVSGENYLNNCPGRGGIDNGRIDVADPVGTNVSDAWSKRVIDFSGIPECNENPNFGVRIMAAHFQDSGEFRQANNVNSIATGGTWRMDNVVLSGDIVLPPPAFIAFQGTHQTFNESAGTVQLTVNVTASNAFNSTAEIQIYSISTAGQQDAVIGSTTIVFPANSNTPQQVSIDIIDDLLPEQTEYLVLQLANLYNAELSNSGRFVVYIKDNDSSVPNQNNEVSLQLLSSYQNGAEGANSTEIVAHDPATQRLAVANSIGNKVNILDFSNPSQIAPLHTIDVSPFGSINSIAIKDGIIAAAIEDGINPQDSGFVMFMNMDGQVLNSLRIGSMPDMISFDHAGNKVVIACEGEPNFDYSQDPEGSVCVIDLSGGIANLTQDAVAFIDFTQFNGQEEALRQQGIRIYGPGASAAQDFEPEYVTISDDDMTAWVSLQENNAIAIIDLVTNQLTSIMPLGYKDHSLPGNGMDVSDQTNAVNIANFPVRGLYLPDAIDQFSMGGQTYLVTANEGDAREYGPLVESVRLSSAGYVLDPTAFPDAAALKTNTLSGRLNVLNTIGDTDGDGDFDEIYCLGSRSFSIWNAQSGTLVYDSGDELEQITSNYPEFSALFNASNSAGVATPKNRSDDKGPEPEGVATGWVNDQLYVFIALERIGGAMVYNITNPTNPYFVTYANNRSAATNGPDRGAEGIIFISADHSPNGKELVLLANEVSSTLTVFQVNSCLQLAEVSSLPSDTSICAGQSIDLIVSAAEQSEFQWLKDGVEIPMAVQNSLTVSEEGSFSLHISNEVIGCSATTQTIQVTVNPLPQVGGFASQEVLCAGETTVLTASGAISFEWNSSVENDIPFVPGESFDYLVTGTDLNGCQNTDLVSITVNPLPMLEISASETQVCFGESVTLTASGANLFVWNNTVENGVAFAPVSSNIYNVIGTDSNGCINTADVFVQVHPLPQVLGLVDVSTVCAGESVVFSGNGAENYDWSGDVQNNLPFVPSASGLFSVVGTDQNGCQNYDEVSITVHALPVVLATASDSEICQNETLILSGQGALTYSWNNDVENGVSFSPEQSGEYQVTGTDENGCQNSDIVSVIVNNLPLVSAFASNQEVCFNDSITLEGGGAETYSWDNGVINAIPFAVTQSNNFTVTGTDANGCSNQAQITIDVNPLPMVEAMSTSDAICYSDEVILFGSGAVDFSWSNGVQDGVPFSPSETMSYTVVGTDANGCTNNAQIEITVNSLPEVTVTFENGILSAEMFSTYQWIFNGLNISGQQSQSWTPIINGYYAVTVVNENGCSATSDQILVIASGVTEQEELATDIYPNPFSEVINFRKPFEESITVELFNAAGSLVLSTYLPAGQNSLNMADYAPGFYSLKLIASNKFNVYRLIKN